MICKNPLVSVPRTKSGTYSKTLKWIPMQKMWDIHSIFTQFYLNHIQITLKIGMKTEHKNMFIFLDNIEHWLLLDADVKGKPYTVELPEKKCRFRFCKHNSWHHHFWNLQAELVFCWKNTWTLRLVGKQKGLRLWVADRHRQWNAAFQGHLQTSQRNSVSKALKSLCLFFKKNKSTKICMFVSLLFRNELWLSSPRSLHQSCMHLTMRQWHPFQPTVKSLDKQTMIDWRFKEFGIYPTSGLINNSLQRSRYIDGTCLDFPVPEM